MTNFLGRHLPDDAGLVQVQFWTQAPGQPLDRYAVDGGTALGAWLDIQEENALLREIVECGCYGGQVSTGWEQYGPCPDCTPLRQRMAAKTITINVTCSCEDCVRQAGVIPAEPLPPSGNAPALGGPLQDK